MTRDEFITRNPLERVLVEHGVKLIGQGRHPTAKCPFHEDKNPSFSVDLDKGLWNCHGGCGGGSVIDFLMRKTGKSARDLLGDGNGKPFKPAPGAHAPPEEEPPTDPVPEVESTIERTYSYTDEMGQEVFQVVRMVPKTFRQRHQGANGQWVWNMQGVTRVLYRLPEVMKAEVVWVCEGEKDADNLAALGFCATTNVGGAKKWLDSYSENLAGKEVVICGDTDEAGQAHVKVVFDSARNKAKHVRLVELPRQFKDVSEYIEGFKDPEKARRGLADMALSATPHYRGLALPVYHIADMEPMYQRHVERLRENALDLGKWLPTLSRHVRHLVPGDFALLLGGTGVGKTSLMTNLALAAQPMPTLFFQFELAGEQMFERTLGTRFSLKCSDLENAYRTGECLGREAITKGIPSVYICYESDLDPSELESIINRSELRIGERPRLVLLDYLGLMAAKGMSRYERISYIAEECKRIAKRTQTILIGCSQIGRKRDDESAEVSLFEGKDSGSLENSAGLVMGAWRDEKDKTMIHLKILKNTKGHSGVCVNCNYNLSTLKITERASEPEPETGNQPYPDP